MPVKQYPQGFMIGKFEFVKRTRIENGRAFAMFKCPYCEQDFEARIDTIQSGRIKTCGCATVKLLSETGMKYTEKDAGLMIGHFTFLKPVFNEKRAGYALLLCACGNKFETRLDGVFAGRIKSCGCNKSFLQGETQRGKGMIRGISTKPIPPMNDADIDRFWRKVGITAQNDKCWEWQTPNNNISKYMSFALNGSTFKCHRIAYYVSNKIDPGSLLVMHACDNRRCCNPAHLSLGTTEDNMRDMAAKGRGGNSKKHKTILENEN